MVLRSTLVPAPESASLVPTPSVPAATLASATGSEGSSSRDAGARRGRRAARPVTTTTGHAELPAAPAAPFSPAWDAPLQPLLEVARSRTEPICLRPMVTRSAPRSEETRIGAPLPPARVTSTAAPPSLDATIVCKNPVLRPPALDEEGGTLVMLTTPAIATSTTIATTADAQAPAMTAAATTEAGTVICHNPLLLVPELAALPGVSAVFLGRLNDPKADDRTPIFVPDGESLEVGSKRGNPFARDPFVARYHAALVPMPEGVLVEDFGTANGVYVRAETRVPLRDDDRLRIGRQLLRFLRYDDSTAAEDSVRKVGSPDPGTWGRLAIMLDAHREAAAYPLRTDVVELGQQTGDVQFPCDPAVGEPHCRLVRSDEGPVVEVEPGGPATYVRVDRGDVVPYGSELLIGETRVRLDRAHA